MTVFRRGSCGSCPAPVIWAVTESTGKATPVDLDPSPHGTIELVARPVGPPLARVVATTTGDNLRTSHSCPGADKHRATRKGKTGRG